MARWNGRNEKTRTLDFKGIGYVGLVGLSYKIRKDLYDWWDWFGKTYL